MIHLEGGNAMNFAKILVVVVGTLLASTALSAEERVVNLVTCELKEGKTTDDLHAANGRWVRYMNDNVPGGDIRSFPAMPIVGEFSHFLYIDSFPNLTSWAGMVDVENAGSDEMKSIMDGLEAVASCSRNALYRAVESE